MRRFSVLKMFNIGSEFGPTESVLRKIGEKKSILDTWSGSTYKDLNPFNEATLLDQHANVSWPPSC